MPAREFTVDDGLQRLDPGSRPRFVPCAHGEWLAAAIPDAEAWLEPDEAHLTLLERRIPDVHAWLLGR